MSDGGETPIDAERSDVGREADVARPLLDPSAVREIVAFGSQIAVEADQMLLESHPPGPGVRRTARRILPFGHVPAIKGWLCPATAKSTFGRHGRSHNGADPCGLLLGARGFRRSRRGVNSTLH